MDDDVRFINLFLQTHRQDTRPDTESTTRAITAAHTHTCGTKYQAAGRPSQGKIECRITSENRAKMDKQKLKNTRGDVRDASKKKKVTQSKTQDSSLTRTERVEELKMRLPATFRDMIEPHKHQIVDFNPTGAHEPRGVPVLFHWAVVVFLTRTRETVIIMTRDGAYRNKPTDGLRHILREFRACNRPRRVAEIPRRDLTAPWLITRPLVCIALSIGTSESA